MKDGVRFFAGLHARPGSAVGATVSVHGLACQVLDEVSAEGVDVVVCIPLAPALLHLDNLTGLCAGGCGTVLQWRPHSPKRPPKMCHACAGEAIRAAM